MTTKQATKIAKFRNNGLAQRILDALEVAGAMSYDELCEDIGATRQQVYNAVYVLRQDLPLMGKRVYISRYVMTEMEHYKNRVPVFALGNEPDAVRPPKQPRKLIHHRNNKKRRAKRRLVNSVFSLGARA